MHLDCGWAAKHLNGHLPIRTIANMHSIIYNTTQMKQKLGKERRTCALVLQVKHLTGI